MDESKPYDHPENKGKLTEYEAFQLDAALAYRYSSLEDEKFARQMHEVRQAIRLTGRYHGKKIQHERFKSDIGDTHDDDGEDDGLDEGILGFGKGSVIE